MDSNRSYTYRWAYQTPTEAETPKIYETARFGRYLKENSRILTNCNTTRLAG